MHRVVTHFKSDRPVAGKTMNSKQVEIVNPPASNPNPITENTTDTPAQPPALAIPQHRIAPVRTNHPR